MKTLCWAGYRSPEVKSPRSAQLGKTGAAVSGAAVAGTVAELRANPSPSLGALRKTSAGNAERISAHREVSREPGPLFTVSKLRQLALCGRWGGRRHVPASLGQK